MGVDVLPSCLVSGYGGFLVEIVQVPLVSLCHPGNGIVLFLHKEGNPP